MKTRLLLFLLLAGTLSLIHAAPILAPSDTVVGGQSDGTNFNVGVIGETDVLNNWPAAKSPDQTVDGVGQKYLNFAKLNTGIAVTPASGSSIAKSLTLWTANDASERDPASYELYGKNSALGAGPFALADFTLISSGALALPPTRNANGASPLLSNASQTVTFAANTTAYTSYLVVFPTVKDDGLANSMQIGEIQLNSSNDDFINADTLVGGSGTVAGDIINATDEAGEPLHAGLSPFRSVWYRWTAPVNGNVTFDTFGAGTTDTLLAAYTGATVNALTEVASNDEAPVGGTTQSQITFTAVAGTTYHIVVDLGFTGSAGPFTLNWLDASPAAPSNDDFTNGQILSGGTGAVVGTNLLATSEAGEPDHAGDSLGQSVWYQWTAPGSGNVTFDTFTSPTDTVLAAYTGATVDALTEIASNDNAGGGDQSQIMFAAVGGTTYHIAVDSRSGTGPGDITLNWSLFIPAPSNDDFADGEILSGPTGTVAGTNVGATGEAGEPDHDGSGLGQSVWYRWTAPASGDFAFDTFTSNFDTILAAYTGATVDALTRIASNDQAGGGDQSEITFTAVGGTTYHIAVDSWSGAGPGAITLNWSLVPTADSINTGFFVLSGSPFSLDTNGSTFDTEIGLFDSTGMLIDSNNDGGTGGQSLLDLPSGLSAGTYYLALGGFNTSFANGFAAIGGNAFGDWLLSLPGSGTRSGTQEANEVTWLRFTVFDPPTGAINLGPLANSGEAFSIDSIGSAIDTELGLYNAFGKLLVKNDDIVSGNEQSEIDLAAGLSAGTYYVALGEFNTNFGDGFAVAGGNAAGDWTLNAPTGAQNGTLAVEEIVWFVFTITDPQPGAIDLGLVASSGNPITINTFGSSFNTDIGLFDAVGDLIAENDDAGGLQSVIPLPAGLSAGTYYVALGGSNTSFAIDFVATGGAAFGDWLLNVPGRTTRSGTQGTGEITWFKFRVSTVPFEITSPGISGFSDDFTFQLGTDLGRIYAIEALQNGTWLEQERFPGTGSSIFYGFPRMDVPAELFRARDITP